MSPGSHPTFAKPRSYKIQKWDLLILKLTPFSVHHAVCVLTHFRRVWCLTLWDPMDCSPSGSSVHGILQSRILEWAAMTSSRQSSWPRDWTCISCSAGRFFTTESSGKPHSPCWLLSKPNSPRGELQRTDFWRSPYSTPILLWQNFAKVGSGCSTVVLLAQTLSVGLTLKKWRLTFML